MFPSLIGTVVIAGIVGYAAEKSGFTRNGILPSIIICVGGAFLFYFVRIMFGIRIGSPAMTTRGFGVDEAVATAHLIADALDRPNDAAHLQAVRERVAALTARFPVYRD